MAHRVMSIVGLAACALLVTACATPVRQSTPTRPQSQPPSTPLAPAAARFSNGTTDTITQYAKFIDSTGLLGSTRGEPTLTSSCREHITKRAPIFTDASGAYVVLVCPPAARASSNDDPNWIELPRNTASTLLETIATTPSQYSPPPAQFCVNEPAPPVVVVFDQRGQWLTLRLPTGSCASYPKDSVLRAISTATNGLASLSRVPPVSLPPAPPVASTSNVVTSGGFSFVIPKSWTNYPQYAWGSSFTDSSTYLSNQQMSDPCTTRTQWKQECSTPRDRLKAGGVVVSLGGWGFPTVNKNWWSSIPGDNATIDKRPAHIDATMVQWWCSRIGGTHETYAQIKQGNGGANTIDACMRTPDAKTRADVLTLLSSYRTR